MTLAKLNDYLFRLLVGIAVAAGVTCYGVMVYTTVMLHAR
jgi:hypothetical protein